ncbi:hypothetical protein [Streptomyces sp. NBC_00696]|nr:hypothetical protein [Streptomyces sp. NBC_00696]
MKRKQKNLHRQLAALPWEKSRAKFYDRPPHTDAWRGVWCRP